MADDPASFGDIAKHVDQQLNSGAQEVRFGGMVIRLAQNQQVKSFGWFFAAITQNSGTNLMV